MSNEENASFIIKTLYTALVASGIGIAAKKLSGKKITFITAILSLFIGVGVAFLSHDLIYYYVTEKARTIVVSLTAILGEKIANYLIFKFNVNLFLDAIQETFLNYFKNKKE